MLNKGKNIGTKIIKISVHSKGQPNKKIIICVITKNCQGARSMDLKKCSNTIVNQVKGVNRVVYDITSKPPGTIEWE